MTAATATPPADPSRLLVTIAVMLTTIMVVLDMTIVNVALPHMMGALGATSEQITWVLTSYMVSDAIVVSLTGFLAARLGQRKLILLCIGGFVASSALCGIATNLPEIVFFRILQGCLGAPIIPLSQAVMIGSFGRNERGKAMAIWGIGIMVAPVLGPTLGGYITDHLDWRWVFYINVPVGILSMLMALASVQDTARRAVRTDWLGMGLMIAGIGGLQLVLDRGNQEDWFNSTLITLVSVIAVAGLVMFVVRGWRRPDNIVNLQLFRDRNFATSSSMMGAFGLGLFGTIAIQPILLEELLGYPAALTGLVMAPRALASAVGMFLVGQLITRIDPRYLIITGIALSAIGTSIMTDYNLSISPGWVVWPGLVQGLGLGMVFVPLSTLAYDTLPREQAAEAAGLFNLMRTIGSSIGISIVATVVTRRTQHHWEVIGGHINVFNPDLQHWLNAQHLALDNPLTAHLLAGELGRQAGMLAFVDAFWLVTWSFIVMAPLVWLLRRPVHDAHAGQDAIAGQ
jgi:MFS transporter, DHA2 family, multidrug resistance protein